MFSNAGVTEVTFRDGQTACCWFPPPHAQLVRGRGGPGLSWGTVPLGSRALSTLREVAKLGPRGRQSVLSF